MKMLPFELDPHCFYCVATGLSCACTSETIVFHYNAENERLSTSSSFPISRTGLRSLYPLWTCLPVGSAVPVLCAA